jgi:hypothetical protein
LAGLQGEGAALDLECVATSSSLDK